MSLSKYLKNLAQIYNRPSGSITATDAQTAIDQLNAGANLVGASTKATPVSGDGFVVVDSADSNKLKRVLYSTLATLFGYIPPAGTILQVVSTTKTDTFSSSASSFTAVTGLSVPITPSSASNKVMVIANVNVGGQTTGYGVPLRITRSSTPVGIGDAAGNRSRSFAWERVADANALFTLSANFLDSPASGSALTYQVEMYVESGITAYVNRTHSDSDAAFSARTISSITVMEVKG